MKKNLRNNKAHHYLYTKKGEVRNLASEGKVFCIFESGPHMSPRWGLLLGGTPFLHTCRPAGAEDKMGTSRFLRDTRDPTA